MTDLRLERVLPADAATIFASFADPDRLARWWGPHGFTIPELRFSPRQGAGYSIEMQPPEGDAFRVTGEFREVAPPRRLSFTFIWDPPDPDDVETVVELFLGDGGLALRQGPFATEERLELHRDGWTQSLDRLASLLEGSAA